LAGKGKERIMADDHGRKAKGRDRLSEVLDAVEDAIRGAIGVLAPRPDAIPIPVRPDRRPGPR
jgi:hypothetical protein